MGEMQICSINARQLSMNDAAERKPGRVAFSGTWDL